MPWKVRRTQFEEEVERWIADGTLVPWKGKGKGVLVLCFDLLTQPKMPFKVMHRKEVTHSDGSYERKSRGRKLADEMGRGKKKSHYTLIDSGTGRE